MGIENTIRQNTKPIRHFVYSKIECEEISNRLLERKIEWIKRGPSFFTLGAASYLDACGNGSYEYYSNLFIQANKILSIYFGDILEKIRLAIENITQQSCMYDKDFALPGFHIFIGTSLNKRFSDNLHLDLQYLHLPFEANIYTPTITFTLPIAIPTGGAGIELCYSSPENRKGNLQIEKYNSGELFFHSGRTLHRRAHYLSTEKCMRITLQGHGLYLNGKWTLYW